MIPLWMEQMTFWILMKKELPKTAPSRILGQTTHSWIGYVWTPELMTHRPMKSKMKWLSKQVQAQELTPNTPTWKTEVKSHDNANYNTNAIHNISNEDGINTNNTKTHKSNLPSRMSKFSW